MKENKPQPASSTSTSKERKGLSIYGLGSSRIELNSIEIPRMRWSPPKARELFLFLLDRAPLSRDETLATFWPDMSLARAAANMRVMLYRLRRVVGTDIILIEDQTYKLSDSVDFEYDVKHFEAIAKSALALSTHEPRRIGLLAKAAALYTGDYLPDLYFDWTLSRREELSSLHNRVLLEYADELINLTRYSEARTVLSKAIIAEPYRDELHERMLICLAELGQRHEMVNY
ncbi:MAG TPA: BTAD domain-containing putative transcriptional regulator, partial [Anaerolineae bacterium]|nr:BTAD domain-containing putative transcriptional regulator [Anaerolineae bacterium]